MTNVYSRKLRIPFEEAVSRVTESLQRKGFGVVTSINIRDIFKQRLNVDFRNYMILGACNPSFAFKAISLESHIGNILPCNILLQQHENGEVEVSAINPMERIDDELSLTALSGIANEVSFLLRAALDEVNNNKRVGREEALPTLHDA